MQKQISRTISIGGFDNSSSAGVEALTIGGNAPIVIQTMWKDRLSQNTAAAVSRINALRKMGCRLLRFAVPDMSAAELLGHLATMVTMPFVADIHFDYKIALRCMDFPLAKIRINPGNIGSPAKVKQVLEKAAAKNIPIRIGINAGSLPLHLRTLVDENRRSQAEALVQAAQDELDLFAEYHFENVIISIKASSIADTLKANRLIKERTDFPLHIGVTEAGPLIAGVTRNAAALLVLLGEGIGDTIRVSLSDTMENEVIAAREILRAVYEMTEIEQIKTRLGNNRGVQIVSCPRCGRNSFDTHAFTQKWLPALYSLDKDISVAIMGCVVNGPGEARHANIGITGAGDKVLLFKAGNVIKTLDLSDADTAFRNELEKV
ncbi:flavodoxin-dependent (E)-4-hydroxy-3-methylbut-2-enyl-diphosphate synthase [Breznakiellaceae bacterium SP9]